jgi:dehydrogenase/reductase SDR family member 12
MDYIKPKLSVGRALIDTFCASLYPRIKLPHEDLQGKRALVTGANIGIGKAIAQSLASQGAQVYLLCRNKEKGEEARKDIVFKTGNPEVYLEVVDFGSLRSVREFVDRWSSREAAARQIDILIHNAGGYIHRCDNYGG